VCLGGFYNERKGVGAIYIFFIILSLGKKKRKEKKIKKIIKKIKK
jgi:hypothetical protein